MALNLVNLDNRTREFMREEVEHDTYAGTLYYGHYLSSTGREDYRDLLVEAISTGNDDTLAAELGRAERLLQHTTRNTTRGVINARVPVNAPQMLAEGEFNRFYGRGLSRRALEDGVPALEVYRAKQVDAPRPQSEALIGTTLDPQALLEDLRTHPGVDPALGLPAGPNSGLSVQLP